MVVPFRISDLHCTFAILGPGLLSFHSARNLPTEREVCHLLERWWITGVVPESEGSPQSRNPLVVNQSVGSVFCGSSFGGAEDLRPGQRHALAWQRSTPPEGRQNLLDPSWPVHN